MEVLKKVKNGFTLIELMVAMTIFSVIAIFVSDIFIELSKFYFNSLSNRSAQQNVKVTMETITRYVKQSSVADWDDTTKTLSLRPKDDVLGIPHDVIFRWDTSLEHPAIKMGIDGSTPTLLTSEDLSISNFSVSYATGIPPIVGITISADIENTENKSLETGLGGNNIVTMSTSTALKAQYNY